HGNVVGGIVADDLGRIGLAVTDVGHLDRGGAVDHVVVGQDLAGGGQHDAGTGRGGLLVPVRGDHVDQAGVHPGRDLVGSQHGLGGGGGGFRRRRVHAADQAAHGRAGRERDDARDGQPAL